MNEIHFNFRFSLQHKTTMAIRQRLSMQIDEPLALRIWTYMINDGFGFEAIEELIFAQSEQITGQTESSPDLSEARRR